MKKSVPKQNTSPTSPTSPSNVPKQPRGLVLGGRHLAWQQAALRGGWGHCCDTAWGEWGGRWRTSVLHRFARGRERLVVQYLNGDPESAYRWVASRYPVVTRITLSDAKRLLRGEP